MKITTEKGARRRKGSALLSVLWLSAALAAIAFSLAVTVRGETERSSTAVDGLRCDYLASAGVDRASMELLWSAEAPPEKKLIPQGSNHVDYVFPSGNVRVEILTETGKLDVNKVPIVELVRLMMALGLDRARSEQIAAAIADWRSPGAMGSPFDAFYGSLIPSFRAPHASFQEIEELLSVKGVTPEIFYGTYLPAENPEADPETGLPAARLVRRAGLIDCLSVLGTSMAVDANTAEPAVLEAVGVPANAVMQIVRQRQLAPLTLGQVTELGAGAGAGRLRLGGNTVVTFRSTARLRLADGRFSDLRRTVAAQVKYMAGGSEVPYYVLRWYDSAWSN